MFQCAYEKYAVDGDFLLEKCCDRWSCYFLHHPFPQEEPNKELNRMGELANDDDIGGNQMDDASDAPLENEDVTRSQQLNDEANHNEGDLKVDDNHEKEYLQVPKLMTYGGGVPQLYQ
jgi:hypothetical protein